MRAKIIILTTFLIAFTAHATSVELQMIKKQAAQLEAQSNNADSDFLFNLKQTILQVEAEIEYLEQNDPTKFVAEIQKLIKDLTLNAKNNRYKTLHPLFERIESESIQASSHIPKLKMAILIINKSTLKPDIKEALNAKILYTIQIYQRLDKSLFLETELAQLMKQLTHQKAELERRLIPPTTDHSQNYSLASASVILTFLFVVFARKSRRKSDKMSSPPTFATMLNQDTSTTIFTQSQIKFWIEDFIDVENLKKNKVVKNIKEDVYYQKILKKMVAEPTILIDSDGKILNTNDQFKSVFAELAPISKNWDELTNHSYANEFDPVTSSRFFGGENFARYGFKLFGEKQEFEVQCLPLKNDEQNDVFLVIFSEIVPKVAQPTVQLSA